jgi:hypothetical protein
LFLRVDERDDKVARQLLTVLTVRVPCSTMTNVELEIAEEMKQRYDQIADTLNAARAKSGQKPITGSAVMQIVLARFAGLPVEDDVDSETLTATSNIWVTRPHGGVKAPEPTPETTSQFILHRPHGGASADPTAKPVQSETPTEQDFWVDRPTGG